MSDSFSVLFFFCQHCLWRSCNPNWLLWRKRKIRCSRKRVLTSSSWSLSWLKTRRDKISRSKSLKLRTLLGCSLLLNITFSSSDSFERYHVVFESSQKWKMHSSICLASKHLQINPCLTDQVMLLHRAGSDIEEVLGAIVLQTLQLYNAGIVMRTSSEWNAPVESA